MLENFKKQRAGFYLNLLLVVLIVVSLILFGNNASLALFVAASSINPGIFLCLIISLICLLGSVIFAFLPAMSEGTSLKAKRFIVDLLRVVSCVLLGLATVLLVGGRIENLGYYFGSDLYLGNGQAIAAVTQALACIIIFAISWVISLIAIFFSQEKE